MKNPWLISIVSGIISSLIGGAIFAILKHKKQVYGKKANNDIGNVFFILTRIALLGMIMTFATFIISDVVTFSSMNSDISFIIRGFFWLFILFMGISMLLFNRDPFDNN